MIFKLALPTDDFFSNRNIVCLDAYSRIRTGVIPTQKDRTPHIEQRHSTAFKVNQVIISVKVNQ
jgi:hypothetical protein